MASKLVISAHAKDCFYISIYKDKEMLYEHDGYLPKFLGDHEDDLELEIDIESGRILNWNPDKINRLLYGTLKDTCELDFSRVEDKLNSKEWFENEINESLATLFYYNYGIRVNYLLDYAIERKMNLACINGKGVYIPNICIYEIRDKVPFEKFLSEWSIFKVYNNNSYDKDEETIQKFIKLGAKID